MHFSIRPAAHADRPAILSLMRGEFLRPDRVDYRHFVVAERDRTIIGAVQIRWHVDGAHELGTLVVMREERRLGVASGMISWLTSRMNGDLFMITGARHGQHYRRWRFERLPYKQAPISLRRGLVLGQTLGVARSLARGGGLRRLAIFHRPGIRVPVSAAQDNPPGLTALASAVRRMEI